jgi:hypothetical protein
VRDAINLALTFLRGSSFISEIEHEITSEKSAGPVFLFHPRLSATSLLSAFSFLLFLLPSIRSSSQTDTIIVHIIHGSKPVKHTHGYRDPGGYFGGHAVLQIGSFVYGFNYTGERIHPVPYRKNRNGLYEKQSLQEWNRRAAGAEVTTIYIPVSKTIHDSLKNAYENYYVSCPHDYAFLGMRCAASAYWMLSRAGIFRHSSRRRSIIHSFHPKMLRKKLVRMAAREHWRVIEQKGSAQRKWEGV